MIYSEAVALESSLNFGCSCLRLTEKFITQFYDDGMLAFCFSFVFPPAVTMWLQVWLFVGFFESFKCTVKKDLAQACSLYAG